LRRKQSVQCSKDPRRRECKRRNSKDSCNFFKNRQRLTQKSCRTKQCLKNLKIWLKFVKDSCRRQNHLKILGNHSNLSNIVADNEEVVKFFQIFERFTNLSSKGVKNASQVQGTATEAVRFILRMDLRWETSSEGTRRAQKRRKNFNRQILCKGPTAVRSARRCTMVIRLERTGESLTCEIPTSFGSSIKRHMARSSSIAKLGILSTRISCTSKP
jgi:hypothetical protein